MQNHIEKNESVINQNGPNGFWWNFQGLNISLPCSQWDRSQNMGIFKPRLYFRRGVQCQTTTENTVLKGLNVSLLMRLFASVNTIIKRPSCILTCEILYLKTSYSYWIRLVGFDSIRLDYINWLIGFDWI